MGHPTLRRPARALSRNEIANGRVRELVRDLRETLQAAGGIGLAAPQIGEPVRVAIIEITGGPSRYGILEPLPLTVFVNPRIHVINPATKGLWEGCLSVPGIRGYVERPQQVRVEYLDGEGTPRELELQGFPATVVQHELDHLDGRLFIDHIADTTKLAFEDEYNRFVSDNVE